MKATNQPCGVGNRDERDYLVREESVNAGLVERRILERLGGSPFTAQKKINAFNFPFTLNPGSGCFFRCNYCYLRQPFFQRHVRLEHGHEMNFVPGLATATENFLKRRKGLPQFMKRVQAGVSTEMFMPQMLKYTEPDKVLRAFQRHGADWMLHLVTKSPAILNYADLLAEMKSQVQVEVSLVTLDEDASRIFESGTPSVAQRLRIIETLANRGVFVRMMLMPVMREYLLQDVDGRREIVYENQLTGSRAPGRKRPARVDGNSASGEVPFEVLSASKWAPTVDPWKPAIVKDWSNVVLAQAKWRDYGAKAYKQKDLNYYYVDELLRAQSENRPPAEERGRAEDPSSEVLIHSGETVRNANGVDEIVQVRGLHIGRKHWPKTKAGIERKNPPMIVRRKMDFGYRTHSPIDWIDSQ